MKRSNINIAGYWLSESSKGIESAIRCSEIAQGRQGDGLDKPALQMVINKLESLKIQMRNIREALPK